MDRRELLGVVGSAGAAATAGCGTLRSSRTLSDPTLHADSVRRRSLSFTADGEEVGSFGVDATVDTSSIDLSTELWHRSGTDVKSITLQVWMPPRDVGTTDVAVVSPVEGDQPPPPTLSLYTPSRGPGTVIEITDLDDLADETISTLNLIVKPGDETAARLVVDATIELTSRALFATDYTLDGRLELSFPELEG